MRLPVADHHNDGDECWEVEMRSVLRDPLVLDSEWLHFQGQVEEDLKDFEDRFGDLRRELREVLALCDRRNRELLEGAEEEPGPEYWIG
jgi:hypothetical protein